MCNSLPVDFEKFKLETNLEDTQIKELYSGFLEELIGEKDKLLAQLDQSSYEMMHKTVHNIKGISSSYMAGAVYSISVELGRTLSGNDRAEIVDAVNRLVQAIMQVADEIYRFCGIEEHGHV